ncbi:carboxypeptidase-like regulatory domain-containing protein [Gynurincola endophyticus]|uniref:carboxypeptidase-like regulatory domain-containing protein n=1 Tax=Gynurincola endophyticus TaxID=2479004 RepID=UPI000F8E20B6|nr:carboxypeptidase-like regulatory domain-containing protein [Gynurincola endophyticus]
MLISFILSILLSLIIGSVASAQTPQHIIGKIMDEESKKPIAYCSVLMDNNPTATISNDQGIFTLNVNNNKKTTFTVSNISYESRNISIGEFISSDTLLVYLRPKASIMEGVVIKAKPRKQTTFGRKGSSGFIMVAIKSVNDSKKINTLKTEDRVIKDSTLDNNEFGFKISLKDKSYRVDDINVYLRKNETSEMYFSVNFYSMKDGLPDKKIATEDIGFKISNNSTGWHNLDLKPYKLSFSEEVVVTLSCENAVKNSTNQYTAFIPATLSVHPTYVIDYGKGSWQKFKVLSSFYATVTY